MLVLIFCQKKKCWSLIYVNSFFINFDGIVIKILLHSFWLKRNKEERKREEKTTFSSLE